MRARVMGYYGETQMAGSDWELVFTCGAKTRRGTYCKMMPVPGKKRCRLHGGLSTGPKTEEGRLRIAEAQRKRWARGKGV